MPDSETFKLILNGGSFGLLAIAVVWLLFFGAPMIRDAMTKQAADHNAAMLKQAADHNVTMVQVAADHKSTVEKVTEACKEETRTLLAWLGRQISRGRWPDRDGTDAHPPFPPGDKP